MARIIIVFEPKFNIGDEVILKLNPEIRMIIDNYKILKVSDSGEVIFFNYILYDSQGSTYTFQDKDLIAITEIV